MHVGITLLLVCAFFTVRHEKFAIVVKCRWGKINFEIKPLCHKITIKTEPNIYLGFEFEFGPKRIRNLAIRSSRFSYHSSTLGTIHIRICTAMAIRVMEFSNGGYKISKIFD